MVRDWMKTCEKWYACTCSNIFNFQIFSLWRLKWQTLDLTQSRSFASGAVGQLVDIDWIALVPARCSQCLNFLADLTVQFSMGKEHTFLRTFWLKCVLPDSSTSLYFFMTCQHLYNVITTFISSCSPFLWLPCIVHFRNVANTWCNHRAGVCVYI